jgi:hypothetical protein
VTDARGSVRRRPPGIEGLLRHAPEAKALFGHPREFLLPACHKGQPRTFQRRELDWRPKHAPEREVFFPRDHAPRRLAQTDFTFADEMRITTRGEVFEHLQQRAAGRDRTGRGDRRINYRHVIRSLVRKPGAFAPDRDLEEFVPSLGFRRSYDALREDRSERRADLEYLRLLERARAPLGHPRDERPAHSREEARGRNDGLVPAPEPASAQCNTIDSRVEE